MLIKDEYYGNLILLIESICEIKNKYYLQTFLNDFFRKHNSININSLFKELVQIVDDGN